MVYHAPAPELIKEPRTTAGMQVHRKFAFNNKTYFQKHVMGNDVKSCLKYKDCLKHPTDFHGKWNYHAEIYNTVFEASSRGHIKTTWTQMLNAQDMLAYPSRFKRSFTNLQLSYSKDQAMEWHTGLDGEGGLKGMLIHASENLDLGYDFSVDNKTNIALKGIAPNGIPIGSASIGRSMGGNVRMKHTDRITLDDIINERMNMSIADIENILLGAVFGTRTPNIEGKNAQVLYIGTVVEEGDPLDKIRKGEIAKGIFRGGEYPGILEEDIEIWRDYVSEWHDHKIKIMDSGEFYTIENELIENGVKDLTKEIITIIMTRVVSPKPRVLWPEKRPIPYHIEQWDTQGEIYYEREILLKLTNQQLALFKDSWINRAKEKGKDWKLRRTPEGDVTAGFDFSISPSVSADYNVFFLTEWVDNLEIPLDMVRFKGADLNTERDPGFGLQGEVEDYIKWKMNDFLDEWDEYIKKAVAEENGFQRMFGNVSRKKGFDVTPYRTGSDKHNRTIGIPSLDIPFRDNRFVIPQRDTYSIQTMAPFVHELKGWQLIPAKKEYKSKAAYDDTTIGWWMTRIAKRLMKQGQVGFGKN
ncbi:MAG: hypothetical protein V3V19_11375 [Cocleimonas sp.]